jgi:hypothetical protein
MPAVSKDAAEAAPHARPWFETPAFGRLLTMRAERVKVSVQSALLPDREMAASKSDLSDFDHFEWRSLCVAKSDKSDFAC